MELPENTDFRKGITLLFDKPKGLPSFSMVHRVRKYARQYHAIKKLKVGHAGTLDPLATGLIIICTGKKTKDIHQFQGMEKEYTGTFRLGAITPSIDEETEVAETFDTSDLTPEMIENAAKRFTGEIDQKPPLFSAVKVGGKRAYRYARDKEQVEIKSKKVIVDAFDITDVRMPEVDFRIVCSKGTYIRSLVFDLALSLDNGAYLTSLRRTRIGPYHVDDAWDIHEFREYMTDRSFEEENSQFD